MRRYIPHIITLVAAFLVAGNAWGIKTLPNSGTWDGGTLENDISISLNGTVNVSGTITIPNEKTLTIINTSGETHTIQPSQAINGAIFNIGNGGKLVITGSSGNLIYINGRTTFDGVEGSDTVHPFKVSGSTYTLATRSTTYKVNEAICNTNGTLTLDYVYIQNIYGRTNGGGILINGTNTGEDRVTTIRNCVIRNCVSEAGSAIHITNTKGTGANAEKCKVVIEDSKIEWNYSWGDRGEDNTGTGNGSGGTIRSNGNCVSNVYLIRTTVQNNFSGGAGGGIYWNGAGTPTTCCYFNNCTFKDNAANGQGGAMMLETTYDFMETGGVTTVTGNKVLVAGGTGGGIVVTSYGGNSLSVVADGKYTFNYNLSDKLIINNNTASAGAGISFNFGKYGLNSDWNDNNLATYQVTSNINFNGATITGNTATDGVGGGIRIYNNTEGKNGNRKVVININLNKGTLSDNTAKTYGGGIYTYKADITNQSSTGTMTIKGNTATSNDGGGIYVDGGTSIMLAATELEDNVAVNGGAIAISPTSNNLSISLGNSKISGNHVSNNGGAIYLPKGNLTIANPDISSNYANNGGALYLSGGSLTTTGTSTVSSNYATTNGGAFYVAGGNVNLAANTVSSNHAVQGGAVYLTGGSLTATGASVIQNNYSTEEGGAYYVSGGTVTLAGATISGNGKDGETVKTTDGGAVYVTGSGAGFNATGTAEISSNAATDNGGAIYVNGGNISLAANTVSSNHAVQGGAVYLTEGSLTATGASVIQDNYSTEEGGAYYVSGGTVTLAGATISGNGKDGETVKTTDGGAVYVTGSGAGFNAEGTAEISSNAATANGGAIYVEGGNINITGNNSVLTIRGNNAAKGGAFYVNGGSIDAGAIKSAEIKNNYSTGEGGAFYVNNGNIELCKTEISGNGKSGAEVKTTNGGAIALYNGVFAFGNGSEIRGNAASGNGGALYVSNGSATSISCEGGQYISNTAKLGGGIYASGPITLTFAADVLDNTAENGGGLYLDGGVDMQFGNGLIVGNKAQGEGTLGVGGGIYLAKGSLEFTEHDNMGIYNNAASYEAADIFGSGTETTIYLPWIKDMNLTGFDVPGSELYWVYDPYDSRYETFLKTFSDQDLNVVDFTDPEKTAGQKIITDKICLDLGYDLVYVRLYSAGLDAGDNAAINIIYKKDGPEITYRKVIVTGSGKAIVGIPSGDWKFEVTSWSSQYTGTPTITPRTPNADPADGFYKITRSQNKEFDITFAKKDDENIKNSVTFEKKKVNKMIPGGGN